MYILGINSAYHESSASLVKDGVLLAAVEEERFSRIKHAKPALIDNADQLPEQAMDFCLRKAGIGWDDIEHIAFSFSPEKRLKRNVGLPGSEKLTPGDWGTKEGEEAFYASNMRAKQKLTARAKNAQFHFIDHHLCHAGSAYYVAPYDEACVITVDGIGEFASTWMGYGKNSELVSLKEIDYPNSLGFLWEKFSEYLGFDRYSGPGKLMGYSAITDSIGQTGVDYLSRMREIVTPESMGFTLDNRILRFRTGDFTGLESLFGPRRNRVVYRNEEAAIASALQEMTEAIMVHLAQQLYKKVKDQLGHPVTNLCLAGGVALNCLANSAILQKTSFTGLYIQPAANDAGTSLGAAFHVWHHHLGNKEKGHVMQHAYTGPEYGEAEIETMLRQQGWEYTRPDDIERTMARLIYDGQVTARYSGALEFGPRALGNRSIVCDPTRFDMREIINTRVKYRESFRPFAPSVLENSMKDLFEDGPAVPADKFMLLVYRTKGREHLRIPAVVQEDECRHINTARAQVVSAEVNPSYNRLIEEFKELSGVGAVLNTSFNIKEPLVCTPGDALKTFNKSGIDVLNIGPFLVKKNA